LTLHCRTCGFARSGTSLCCHTTMS
jgi:hypothetical protein